MEAKGLRDNNPGNIRASTCFKWRGQCGRDDDGFCIFNSALYGLRAIAMLVRHYRDYHNLQTISGIISRWAPPEDNNNTAAYIAAVAKEVGISPDHPIDWDRNAAALVRAIVIHENGACPYPDSLIRRGIIDSKVQ